MRVVQFVPPLRSFLDVALIAPGQLRAGSLVVFGASHGTPYPEHTEMGYAVATGSALAPQAIRDAANQSSMNIDHYDFDLGGPLLADGGRALVDLGDLTLSATNGDANRLAIQRATQAILAAGAVPVLLGGDDSAPIPMLAGFAGTAPIDILQIDAHIDWRDSVGGEPNGYSSTMKRASEHPAVRSITQVGMRGVGSARLAEVDAAHAWGARLITVTNARQIGMPALAASLPRGGRLVIQVDCDGFDPSVCPAVNAPSPGGFRFDEVAELVRLAIGCAGLAAFSIVELKPDADINEISAIAAARLTCSAIGAACRQSQN